MCRVRSPNLNGRYEGAAQATHSQPLCCPLLSDQCWQTTASCGLQSMLSERRHPCQTLAGCPCTDGRLHQLTTKKRPRGETTSNRLPLGSLANHLIIRRQQTNESPNFPMAPFVLDLPAIGSQQRVLIMVDLEHPCHLSPSQSRLLVSRRHYVSNETHTVAVTPLRVGECSSSGSKVVRPFGCLTSQSFQS